ncbi:metalloprotease [Thermogymnomonas acidicola]|uniref:Metalloprotease n=1 Tax=Thermogymnomonas acidicola TaxID=399579 RepID=A0AA37F9F5_9ARCH|nr:Mov34/MPN/PAD-1 family protein [Thermogymnomonas acidicola]GGM72428.1 metalloprotease [Thermogymnomonas acidicola]
MWSIKRRTLLMIMEASKSSYPKEFGAFLRAYKDVIYEIAVLPGTIQGDHHTIFLMYTKPIDFSIVGTVHSHPSGVRIPSDEDLHMFSNTGPVHIIVGYPFGEGDFTAFRRDGREVEVRVI